MSISPGESRTATEDTQALVRRFARWALEQLKLDVQQLDQPVAILHLPESEQETFDGASQIEFTFDKSVYDADSEGHVEFVTPGSRLLSWITRRVEQLGSVAHAEPVGQPISVHELTDRLFSPYTVDDGAGNPGTLQLAGCTLDDRLVLRLTFRATIAGLEPHDELIEVLVDDTGAEVPAELVTRLGLTDLENRDRPPRIQASALWKLVEAGTALVDDRCDRLAADAEARLALRRRKEEQQLESYFDQTIAEVSRDLEEPDLAPEERADVDARIAELREARRRRLAMLHERYAIDANSRLVTATLLWCKHAAGKLRFRIGANTVDLAFHDWARELHVPPFVCPATGVNSWHVTATDNGEIVAAESIEVCARTGRRLLRRDLRQCAVSGQWVVPDELVTCPVFRGPPAGRPARGLFRLSAENEPRRHACRRLYCLPKSPSPRAR